MTDRNVCPTRTNREVVFLAILSGVVIGAAARLMATGK
jgi:hypothetical protein